MIDVVSIMSGVRVEYLRIIKKKFIFSFLNVTMPN